MRLLWLIFLIPVATHAVDADMHASASFREGAIITPETPHVYVREEPSKTIVIVH